MAKTIRIHAFGGPEVIQVEDVDLPPPGPGEVRLRQRAIGLNFIDVYQRKGVYPNALPLTLGNEAAGDVVAVGPDVTEFAVGDRVAYGTALGAYAEERNVAARQLVHLPEAISYEVGAVMMLKGLTAQYLLRQTYKVKPGDTILVHAAAGGVGLFLCQWGKALGATVIGTAGSAEKGALARRARRRPLHRLPDEDFAARVKEITDGELCNVVYDAIGKATFPASLDCLRPLGMFASFGAASGAHRGLRHQPPGPEGLALRHAAVALHLCGQARSAGRHDRGPHDRDRERRRPSRDPRPLSRSPRWPRRTGARGTRDDRQHDPGALRRESARGGPRRSACRCRWSRSAACRRASGPSRPTRTSTSTCAPARTTRCWARTAPASRPWSRCSTACCSPRRARSCGRAGAVVLDSPETARALGIGMVFQHFSLFENLTVVGEHRAGPAARAAEPARRAHRRTVGALRPEARAVPPGLVAVGRGAPAHRDRPLSCCRIPS